MINSVWTKYSYSVQTLNRAGLYSLSTWCPHDMLGMDKTLVRAHTTKFPFTISRVPEVVSLPPAKGAIQLITSIWAGHSEFVRPPASKHEERRMESGLRNGDIASINFQAGSYLLGSTSEVYALTTVEEILTGPPSWQSSWQLQVSMVFLVF